MADFRPCRTTPPGWWSTTPTRTSWSRRHGCATTPTPASATASSPSATRAATSCARPATRPSSSRPRAGLRPAARTATPARSTAAVEAAEIMQRKNFAATGSFVAEDRPRALDLLGFASQLVFNTFHNRRLRDWEHGGDRELAHGAARAHNRGMVEFCSVDPRLLPTCYVPLADLDRAGADGRGGDRHGRGGAAGGLRLPARPLPQPRRPRPGVGRGQEAGIPVVFHVGGTGDLIDPAYFRNGLPVPPDFHGGEENFRSVDYMGIPGPPAQTLATMIFDGVLERFPDLRIGVIEQGAIWVPSWTAPDGVGVRGVRPPRGAAAGPVAAPHRVRPPPGPVHALPHRGRGLDHRPGRARGVPVLVRLPPRRGRPPADRALRGVARRRLRARCARPSTATTSST